MTLAPVGPVAGLRSLAVPAILVSGLGLLGPIVSFAAQVVIAARFGASTEMDAFLAAAALPQYLVVALSGALGLVLVPLFVSWLQEDGPASRRAIGSILMLAFFALATTALGAAVLARPLLRHTVPGLSPEQLELAVTLARYSWPTIAAAGLASILAAFHQACRRFVWAGAVPVFGAFLNLLLLPLLVRRFGIVGVAWAALASAVLQCALLLPFAWGGWGLIPVVDRRVREALYLLAPVLTMSLASKCTTVFDRYLASDLTVGSISHLGYSSRLATMVVVLLSSGVATVVSPTLAQSAAEGDRSRLKETLSTALRYVWLFVAPTVAIGWALASGVVSMLFERGQFTAADSHAVASLLRVYLLATVGGCLASITGRVFYALKDSAIITGLGLFEAALYVVAAWQLSLNFGVAGIAWAFVILYSFSLLTHGAYLLWRLGPGGYKLAWSFSKTSFAAATGAAAAWYAARPFSSDWAATAVGCLAGLAAFIACFAAIGSAEASGLATAASQRIHRPLEAEWQA